MNIGIMKVGVTKLYQHLYVLMYCTFLYLGYIGHVQEKLEIEEILFTTKGQLGKLCDCSTFQYVADQARITFNTKQL
jgi:hypothetical protein